MPSKKDRIDSPALPQPWPYSKEFTFQSLPEVPVGLPVTQCVWFNSEELLMCGGSIKRDCYSYHIEKCQYRHICDYPKDVALNLIGHAVVICSRTDSVITILNHYNNYNYNNNNNNKYNNKEKLKQILLLSFGGQRENQEKHTLMMIYQSVWNETKKIEKKNSSYINQWIPAPFDIGKKEDEMRYVRALIGGSKNHLLFIIYNYHHIEVFDFILFQSIIKYRLPYSFDYSSCCFTKLDSGCNHMILFYKNNGAFIKYNEQDYTFEHETIPVCGNLLCVADYSYICREEFVVLFGGYDHEARAILENVYVYSKKKKIWWECSHRLPLPLDSSFSILDPGNNWVHIITGSSLGKRGSQHLKIRLRELIGFTLQDMKVIIESWMRKTRVKMGWIIDFDAIIANYING